MTRRAGLLLALRDRRIARRLRRRHSAGERGGDAPRHPRRPRRACRRVGRGRHRARASRSIRSGRSRCRTTGCSARRSACRSTRSDHVWIIHRHAIAEPRTESERAAEPADRRRAARPRRRSSSSTGGQPRRPWGGPGAGLRLADVEPRHHRRSQGQRLDRRQRRQGRARPEVHARRQVPAADRQAGARTQRQQRPENFWPRREDLRSTPKANEAYVADGYGNKRVVVHRRGRPASASATGARTATSPTTPTSAATIPTRRPRSSSAIPCTAPSRRDDGFVYVCDRVNDRIQVFRKDGTFVKEAARRARARAAPARCGTSRSRRTRSRRTSISPTA